MSDLEANVQTIGERLYRSTGASSPNLYRGLSGALLGRVMNDRALRDGLSNWWAPCPGCATPATSPLTFPPIWPRPRYKAGPAPCSSSPHALRWGGRQEFSADVWPKLFSAKKSRAVSTTWWTNCNESPPQSRWMPSVKPCCRKPKRCLPGPQPTAARLARRQRQPPSLAQAHRPHFPLRSSRSSRQPRARLCSPGALVGPLISAAAQDKALSYIEVGRKEGRLVWQGAVPDRGWYVPSTIFAGIRPEYRLAREEIFGPVLAVLAAPDFTTALAMANDSDYALTGGVYSRYLPHLAQAQRAFTVGNLYLNRRITGARVGILPFGGIALSGTGIQAGGPDYLKQFLWSRCVSANTMCHGFMPG